MAKKLYEESSVQDIAAAIREKNGTATKYKVAEMGAAVRALSGSEAVEWHQCPELVRNYLANVTYDPSDYSTSQIAEYAPGTAVVSNYRPIGKTLGGKTYYNQVPGIETPFAATGKAGTLKPLDYLRYIQTAAANVRDLGGWACDGGRIKYGLLYRGGYLVAADRTAMVDELGVMHDLDLRGTNEAALTASPLGDDVYYTCAKHMAWYTLTADCWRTNLRTIFDAATHNEPVYFHCSAGADRTGTLACVIEGLLGVSQSDIDKDYELTCFYSGTDTDNHARRRNESEWQGLIAQIGAKSGTTFRDKCVTFASELGFTAAEINAFRAAMIDGTPETVTPSISTFTVTNALTNVVTNNDATNVTQYQPYTAKIVPASGKTIGNIKVTMGGTDITASVFKGTTDVLRRSITQNLTQCASNNARGYVIDGQSYVETLTAHTGYVINSVTILMGGVDVSTYYKDGIIAIPEVTGDIVITAMAVAQAPSYTNQIPISTDASGDVYGTNGYTLNTRLNSSGNVVAASGYLVTGFIPCAVGDTIRLNKFVTSLNTYGGNAKILFFDSSRAKISGTNANKFGKSYGYSQGTPLVFVVPSTVYSTDDGADKSLANVAYVRLAIGGYNDAADSIICTINEEIA